ncbi:MAG: hypothetical protein APR53_08890 [Methanoculleus sp. SDB]|nr:MAG: hypothetical protein APR53_08890 [Methanoculleus sp. SDB]
MTRTKLLTILLIFLLVVTPALAANNKGAQEAAQNGAKPTVANATPAAGSAALHAQQTKTVMIRAELTAREQERQQELDQELQSVRPEVRNVYLNQNTVRVAVHTLLGLENSTYGIGRNISAVAREFNNSVQATIVAEERLETRSGFVRFFAGGDDEAAAEILQLTAENRLRIQEMNRLIAECDCDNETRTYLQEQLQIMTQEQTRLESRAQAEQADRGLFGWLWK